MKKFFTKYLLIVAMVLVTGSISAYVGTMYRSNPNTGVKIDKHGVCLNVLNSGSGLFSYFIPTDTAIEWSLFRTAASSLPDISLTSCADLVNNVHTSTECTALGGTVQTDSSGNKFCYLSGGCSSGWTQYQNWRATTPKTCSIDDPYSPYTSVGLYGTSGGGPGLGGFGFCSSPCTTGSSFSNTSGVETCTYEYNDYGGNESGGCANHYASSCSAVLTSGRGCY